jgi:PAS domain S-box-containing protein
VSTADLRPVDDAGTRLRSVKGQILRHWEEGVRRHLAAAQVQPTPALRNHLPHFLDNLADALSDPDVRDESRYNAELGKAHGGQRVSLPLYSLAQVLTEYHVLRRVVFEVLEAVAPLAPRVRNLVDAFIDIGMITAASEFVHVRQTRLLKAITDNATACLFMRDAEGRCTSMNQAAERATGYTFEEAKGRSIHDLIHHTRPGGAPFPLSECPIDQPSPENQPIVGHEDVFVRKNGTFFPAVVAVSPIVEGGVAVGSVLEVRDVTDEKRAEAERAELLTRERAARAVAEAAVQLRDDFLARASHELRTPLTSALGSTRLLKKALAGALKEPPEALIEVATRNMTAMVKLIDQLLDLAKLAAGRESLAPEMVELDTVVRDSLEVVGAQAREKGVRMHVKMPEGLTLYADAPKLEQVLMNLLANAIKFTPRGGEVVLEADRDREGVTIRVRDTGAGIPAESLETIFEPFVQAAAPGPRRVGDRRTRRVRGTGLGLAIARQIVGLHGGRIWAESHGLGRGSTFVVTLLAPKSPPTNSGWRSGRRGRR